MKQTFPQQVFWSMPVLLAFLLPFGGIALSLVVVLWFIFSFFNLNRQWIRQAFQQRAFWIPLLFFVLTLISAAFSANKKEAATAIEIKMSFIILPWLFFAFYYPPQILKKCLVAFVSGNFFASVFLLIRAVVYAAKGDSDYFFYTKFSDFIHASYFSMYLIFAITIIVMFYNRWFHHQKEMRYMSYFFIALFSLCIFLCSSKLGILSFFVMMPVLYLYKNRQYVKPKYLAVMFLICMMAFVAAYKLFPESFQRLQSITALNLSSIDKTSKESTTVRILIWQQALHLSFESPFFGVGVGDANDFLYKAYEENGLTGALQYHLNAHNQYLQTFLGLGIIGLILLFDLTWLQLFRSRRKKNFLFFVFAFLICVNFLVESMLQTSAGVLFFTFFYCFNSIAQPKGLSHA